MLAFKFVALQNHIRVINQKTNMLIGTSQWQMTNVKRRTNFVACVHNNGFRGLYLCNYIQEEEKRKKTK